MVAELWYWQSAKFCRTTGVKRPGTAEEAATALETGKSRISEQSRLK
jgi:hypothetical protein